MPFNVSSFVQSHPWLVLLGIVGLLVQICAAVIVIRSSKFLRKWAWLLCCIVSFSYKATGADGYWISIGIPVGALFVIWFLRFGRCPTEDQIAKRATKTRPPVEGTANKLLVLRIGYLACTASAIFMAWLAASGKMAALFKEFAGGDFEFPPDVIAGQAAILVGIGLVFVFLALRPYWWGKILSAWAGLAWTGFGAIGMATFSGSNSTLIQVLTSGVVMLAALVAHQIVDPRFGGTYLRSNQPAI